MIENRTKFIPIRGPVDKIKEAEKQAGAFYIATDTGEMFLDVSNANRIPVGGAGVKIYYTQQSILEDDLISEEELTYKLQVSAIESNFNLSSAKVNDLIIEKDTETFYRIQQIVSFDGYDEDGNLIEPYLICSKMAISGAASEESDKVRIVFKNLDEISRQMQTKGTLYIYGESFPITFRPWMETGNAITVTCKLISSGTTYYTFAETIDVTIDAINTVTFDIGKQLRPGKSTIYVEATGGGNIPATLTYEANTINFELKKSDEFAPQMPIKIGDPILFKAIPIGGIKKNFYYAIDAPEDNTNPLGFNPQLAVLTGTEEISDKVDNNVYSFAEIPTNDLLHGAHTLKAWMTDAQSGKIVSNILTYQLGIYNPENRDSIVWIIDCPEQIEIYDKLKVKFGIYDPASVGQDNYVFQKIDCMTEDNVVLRSLGGSEYVNGQEFLWTITKFNLGNNGYKILYGEQEKVLFYVKVVGSTRENMTLSNTATLKINLEASGRSNAEIASSREYWPIKEKTNPSDPDPLTVKFNNFNWSTDGWMTDNATEETYLLLANGSSVQIPIPGALAETGLTINNNKKYTFEIRGRIKNIKDYSTLIKNNTKYWFIDPTDPEKSRVIGPNLTNNKYGNYMSLEEVNEQYGAELGYEFTDADIKHDEFKAEIVQVFKEIGGADKCCASFFIPNTLESPIGIGLGTQETYFNSGLYAVNAKYKEEEMFSLTYVIDFSIKRAFIYLNGLLTGASVLQSNAFNIGTNYFTIDSTLCDFELYSFRFYEDALNAGHIVQNYLYDIRDVDTYDQNNIAEISQTGDLDISFEKFIEYNEKMTDAKRPEMLTMPYMVLEVVDNLGSDKYNPTAADLPDHLTHINAQASIEKAGHRGKTFGKEKNDQRLPYIKNGGKRLVKVSFVNPSLDYALEHGTFEPIIAERTRAGETIDIVDYYTSRCPSFEAYGAELAVQGTSSQAYPRRNYKLKLKDSDFWIYSNKTIREKIVELLNKGIAQDIKDGIKEPYNALEYACPFCVKPSDKKTNKYSWRMEHENPLVGTTKFTLKIDYMESSGSYNTGFANLIDTIYNKHPLDYYITSGAISGLDDGYYKENDYRTSVQGFPIAMFHKIKRDDGSYTYNFIGRYNMNLDKGSDDCYGFKASEKNITVDKELSKITECWEMSNNQGTYCSFKANINSDGALNDNWSDVKYDENNQKIQDTDPKKNFLDHIAKHIECRYNNKDDELEVLTNYIVEGERGEGYTRGTLGVVDTPEKPEDITKPTGETYTNFVEYCTNHESSEDRETKLTGLEITDEATRTAYLAWADYDVKKAIADEDISVTDIETATNKYYKNIIKLLKWMFEVDIDRAPYATDADVPLAEQEKYAITNAANTSVSYQETWTSPEDRFVKEVISGLANEVPAGITKDNFYFYRNIFTTDPLYIDLTLDKAEQFKRTINFPLNNGIYDLINLETATEEMQELFGTSGYLKYDPSTGIVSKLNSDIAVEKISDNGANITIDIRAHNPGNQLTTVSTAAKITKNFLYDTKEYRKARFKKEFTQHWNLDYCLIYFVMTELLLCYDSRGKNLMIASWGPMATGGEYIWFPIFYDIDTQLGINNTGIPTWDYNQDASVNVDDPSKIAFSTSQSVLWRNLLECFPAEIAAKYRELRKTGDGRIGYIDENFIEHMYRCENGAVFSNYSNMGVRPLSILNADAEFKYIKTTLTGTEIVDTTQIIKGSSKLGYYNTSGDLKQDAGGAFFYAVQGDRDLSRRLLLRNRINYLDSYWGASSYSKAGATGDTSAWMRLNANSLANTSDKIWFTSNNAIDIKAFMEREDQKDKSWNDVLRTLYNSNSLEFASAVPENVNDFENKLRFEANPHFNITPFLDQYISVGYDDIYTSPIHANGGRAVLVKAIDSTTIAFLSTPSLSQQLVYVPGAEYISDLGDLSVKYLDEIHLQGATRLTKIILGSPLSTYENKNLQTQTALGLADALTLENNELNPYRKTLLEEIELSGLVSYNGAVDVSGSPKLKSFKALRTATTSVIMSPNSPIETLFLPGTITNFDINNFINLHKFINPTGNLQQYPTTEKGLYFEGFGSLQTFKITQDHLGYDSYNLIANYLRRDEVNGNPGPAGSLTNVNITGINWMPYELIESVADIDPTKTYYKRKLNGTFEIKTNLNPTSDTTLAKQVTDKLLYKQVIFDNADIDAPDLYTIQQIIQNNNNTNTKYILSGNMFVNNTLSQTSMKNNVSQLTVYAASTNPCRILHFIYPNGNNETIIYHTYKAEFGQPAIQPSILDIDPILSNKDFIGWKVYHCIDEDNKGTPAESINIFRVNKKFLTSAQIANLTDADYTIEKDEYYVNQFEDPSVETAVGTTVNDIYIFEAQFAVHQYKIEFMDIDNTTVKDVIYVPAGNLIPKTNFIPLKTYTGTDLYTSNKFIGWRRALDSNTLENFATARSTADRVYYPLFREVINGTEEALIDINDNNNFEFENNSLIFKNVQYSGKVTLPKYSSSGVRIEKLIGLRETQITHVFWYNNLPDENTESYSLGLYRNKQLGPYNDSSWENKTLVYFEIPDDITTISAYSFYTCTNLTNILIPGSINSLGKQAFANIGTVKPTTIQIGSLENPIKVILFTDSDSNALYQTFIQEAIIYYTAEVKRFYESEEALGIGVEGEFSAHNSYWCKKPPTLNLV